MPSRLTDDVSRWGNFFSFQMQSKEDEMKIPLPCRLRAFLLAAASLVFLLAASSCGKSPPADPYCSYSPLPAGAEAKAGQGALQVEGTIAGYFYVFDKAGKQIGYQSLGKTLAIDPGEYQLKVNQSTHPVAVEKGMLTKCSTGTLMVSGATSEYYYVMDSANNQLHYDSLNKASSLLPGTYRVKVNNTEVSAEVKLNETAEVKAGTVIVRGSTSEYYYVVDSLGKQLGYNSLEKPLAFMPGTYTVKVNNTETQAAIAGGQITELKTGALLVKGATDEYFYVLDSLGKQLNYQKLNQALSFFPGTLRAQLNKTQSPAEIAAGETREVSTGSLTVTGTGSDYYYVMDQTGNQLNYSSLNKALSFFPAAYTVKLGQKTQPATVTAGQATTLKF